MPAEKTARLNRLAYITEKLDGSRATIFIDDSGELFCGSRTRWITPLADNFGFARWAEGNQKELLKLGPGRHDGEWWGHGIQRNYGLKERRFSLFNAGRWSPAWQCGPSGPDPAGPPGVVEGKLNPNGTLDFLDGPRCCYVVPTIWSGNFDNFDCRLCLEMLRLHGSFAVPGWKTPEGIVIYHEAAKKCFKVTLEHDEKPKSLLLTEDESVRK